MAFVAPIACDIAPPHREVEPLSTALRTAFRIPATASVHDSGRILAISVDTTPTPETALRVAQFARTHYDSVTKLDAILLQFEHIDQDGAIRHTTVHRSGAFLPATLPVDTAPGWAQAMLAPTPTPALAVGLLTPVTDSWHPHPKATGVVVRRARHA